MHTYIDTYIYSLFVEHLRGGPSAGISFATLATKLKAALVGPVVSD